LRQLCRRGPTIMPAPPRRLTLFDNAMAAGGSELVTGTPTVISAACYFETLPERGALEALVLHQLMQFDVLSGRPEGGQWRPVSAFDLTRHLLFHEVEDEDELTSFVNANAAEPLVNKAEGPWFEIHAVSTSSPQAREMLFFRIEHACADGIALLQILSRIATTADGSPLPVAEYSRSPKPAVNPCSLLCDFLRGFCKYATLPLGAFDTQLPLHPPKTVREKGLTFSRQRHLVTVPAHPLEAIKVIKHAVGGQTTVNDIVYSAFAGALRRHARELASSSSDTTAAASLDDGSCRVRALVPLAFPRSATSPLTNDWTFLSLPMPVGVSEARQRVDATHATFASVKASAEAAAARLAVQINSCSPPLLLGTVAQQLFSRHTCVFSNVPGPAEAVYIAGQRVVAIYSAFPNLILQVLCLSYNGQMYMSIACDDSIPQADDLAALYLDELRELAKAYGVQDRVTLPAAAPKTAQKTKVTPPAAPPMRRMHNADGYTDALALV